MEQDIIAEFSLARGNTEATVLLTKHKYGVKLYSVYGTCGTFSSSRPRCAKTLEKAEEIAEELAEYMLTKVTGMSEEQYLELGRQNALKSA